MMDVETRRAIKLVFFFAILALLSLPMWLLNAGFQSLDFDYQLRAMKVQQNIGVSENLWNLIWNVPRYFNSFATVVDLMAGIGLLCLKRWARRLVIATVWCRSGLAMLLVALLFWVATQRGEGAEFAKSIFFMLFWVIAWSTFVTYCLSRPKVKEQFK